MKNLKTLNEARHIAKELLKQAKENEPTITADLQNIAREVDVEMIGLEHKFKTEISIIRKLIGAVGDDLQRLRRKSKNINDVLRYTFVLAVDTYAKDFRQTIERLWELGYRVPENRIWNAWENIGTKYDKGYRGINITVISFQKQKFELQFHTEASFRLKTETHFLYKELRKREISEEREIELIEDLKKAAGNLERPQGV